MNSLRTQKIEHLLIPVLATGTLILNASSVNAASFVLDDFNQTSSGTPQLVRSTRTAPNPAPNTHTGLTTVFGGSRQLAIDSTSLTSSFNPLIRTTIQVSPTAGELSITNAAGVISQTSSTYNANGAGFNNTSDSEGNSLGNWLTGKYQIDFFALSVVNLDTIMDISLKLGFANGKTGTITRNILNPGSNIAVTNNPILLGLPNQYKGSNIALFSLAEYIGQNGIVWQDFQSVSYAQLSFTGSAAFDGNIDFVKGGAVPEPLTILGAATAIGFGVKFKHQLAKAKQHKKM